MALKAKVHMKLTKKSHLGLQPYAIDRMRHLRDHFDDVEPSLLDTVERRLMDKADGMFLWVRLVVAMLLQETSEDGIKRRLDRLPDGLEEAYASILERSAIWVALFKNVS